MRQSFVSPPGPPHKPWNSRLGPPSLVPVMLGVLHMRQALYQPGYIPRPLRTVKDKRETMDCALSSSFSLQPQPGGRITGRGAAKLRKGPQTDLVPGREKEGTWRRPDRSVREECAQTLQSHGEKPLPLGSAAKHLASRPLRWVAGSSLSSKENSF